MPSIFRYWIQTGFLYCQESEGGVSRGQFRVPEKGPEQIPGCPHSAHRVCRTQSWVVQDIALHFLCIFFKAFRAVRKVLIDPRKIPAAFITLSWLACAGLAAGLRYGQGCPAAAGREGSGHRAVQRFCSQMHVLGKILIGKWDRLHPASPALQCLCHT